MEAEIIIRKNPNRVRVHKINSLRTDIFHHIDSFYESIETLEEYWLSKEADCVREIIKDYWKHESMLNNCLCDADSEIKEAQSCDKEKEEGSEKETIECSECGRSGEKCDTCPDCWYEFNS